MTKADYDPGQTVYLPKVLDRLARIAAESGGAIAVSQPQNNVFLVNTGRKKFYINAQGNNIDPPKERPPC